MQTYHLNENGQFMIEDYQNARPFSSFLPGISGSKGVPLWNSATTRFALFALIIA